MGSASITLPTTFMESVALRGELADMVSLTSHPVLGIPCLCLRELELQTGYHAHFVFVQVLGIWIPPVLTFAQML